MKQPTFNLILLGDPASGKGTQARVLARKCHFYNFDMGKEVRKPAVLASYDYAHTTAIGKLTPTSVARGILRRVISKTPAQKGLLFNGHPKMIGEAQFVSKWLKKYKRRDPLVLYVHIPMEETLIRARRRVAYVAGKRRKRDDDAERAIRNRKRYYKEQVSRVVTFFKKKYTVKFVSGMGTRAEVAKRIEQEVKKFLAGKDR
jgi:adenylate kinase